MSDPDSIVQYVTWLDNRHNRLVDAVMQHRAYKKSNALPGTIDEFDRTLWAVVDGIYDETSDPLSHRRG